MAEEFKDWLLSKYSNAGFTSKVINEEELQSLTDAVIYGTDFKLLKQRIRRHGLSIVRTPECTKLMACGKKKDAPLEVVSLDQFYDLIRGVHEETSHEGINKTFEIISERYWNITRAAVVEFVERCSVCQLKRARSKADTDRSVSSGTKKCVRKSIEVDAGDITMPVVNNNLQIPHIDKAEMCKRIDKDATETLPMKETCLQKPHIDRNKVSHVESQKASLKVTILDTVRSCPACGVPVSLAIQTEHQTTWETLEEGVTNSEGILSMLNTTALPRNATYRLEIDSGAYFLTWDQYSCYQKIETTFLMWTSNQQHHQISIHLSSTGYSMHIS